MLYNTSSAATTVTGGYRWPGPGRQLGSSPQTVNGSVVGAASLSAADPAAGTWQIQVVLNLTVSGKEFLQTVHGDVQDP
jgi:hypothetical protein